MKHLALIPLAIIAVSAAAVAQETSGSFTQGSIKVGYDSRTCNVGLAGSLRYNSSVPKMQMCNGSSWQGWGG